VQQASDHLKKFRFVLQTIWRNTRDHCLLLEVKWPNS
jgi:hypothetical protein